MIDNYSHIGTEIVYTKDNILGPKECLEEFQEIFNNFNSQLSWHCQCQGSWNCILDTCCCVKASGGPNYTASQLEDDDFATCILSDKDFDSYPLIECNNLCPCNPDCGNRVVQKGPIDDLVVKDTVYKGLGLFCNENINRGTFICEYAGEIITKTTAMSRQKYNQQNDKMNYLYCLNEHCSGKVVQTFIDPSYFGNIGRYINHSCDPNCFIIPVRVNSPIPKLAVFSNSLILKGSELTFDYGFPSTMGDDVSRKKCLCGTTKCRDFMPYNLYGDL